MEQVFTLCLALALTGSLSAQQTAGSATDVASPRARREAAARQSRSNVADELRAMREQIQAQQQQIQQLQQQVQQSAEHYRQLQLQVQEAASTASAAQSKASEAVSATSDQTATVSRLQSDVADVKSNFTAAAAQTQEDQKRVNDVEHPNALRFRGITITPGGFLEAAGIFRNRNENASVNSAAGDFNIPFSGSANGQLSEFRFDARQSRLTLLGEGKIGSNKVSGYYEVDFLGAAPTANENQSNSFNPRQRQLWGQAAFANGVTFTGGQQWSLFTLTRKGMENRNEFLPMTINAQYVIGYDWARQPAFRVMKNFHDKAWLGFAVENASTVLNVSGVGITVTGNPATLAGIPLSGFNTSANAQSPNGNFTLSNTPGANGVSTNVAPDVAAKFTLEPGWGHFEVKGVGRFFRDRYKGSSDTTLGGGFGLAAILPLMKSKLDLIAEGSLGNGVGRYGSGGGADVTLRPDGTIQPMRTYHAIAGPEIHVGKNLDMYAYAGGEYYKRTYTLVTATSSLGYGSPLMTNTGCNAEQTGTTAVPGCGNNTRAALEFTPGFWYRFYKGSAGTVQWGVQYSYSSRGLWRGVGGAPDANLSQVYTSFRYYLP